ncbi:iron ABC transporter permease [Chitinophaga horti]|uniref:Iron ABC transporter permease n=1 Tax=Chitinophaga horti TaxID=2920382 RepID=A0ABY6J0C4_9BACT|nr:iron ABC transporter permease [Chitinophaga horti]UYQ93096.1 iron ABC transporter permease [Chitinophaga horti]
MNKGMKRAGIVTVLVGMLIAAVVFSTGIGAMPISPMQVIAILLAKTGIRVPVAYEEGTAAVLWMIRLPRVVLGVIIGAGLGIAGAALQGLFRNPLADPGLIGVSAGASLTAVMLIVLQSSFSFFADSPLLQYYLMNIVTFCGAVVAVLIVFRISLRNGQAIMSTMLLAGIAINALCNAITGLMTYVSTNEQLRSIIFWLMGSLGGASWRTVLAVLPFVVLPLIFLPRIAYALNVFALGEREAMHSGVKVSRLKTQLIICATMAVAAGVAVAGVIGFVGLVVPHIVRQVTGPDNRILIPCSALLGAVLLTVSDLLCRTIAAPAEIPVGIVTAIIGTPFFIWLILKEKKSLAI